MPGIPSPFRARNTPSLAIHMTTSPMVGVFFGSSLPLLTFANRTFHSWSATSSVHGVSGLVLAIKVIKNNRQATMLIIVRYLRRSNFPSLQFSTGKPDFRILQVHLNSPSQAVPEDFFVSFIKVCHAEVGEQHPFHRFCAIWRICFEDIDRMHMQIWKFRASVFDVVTRRVSLPVNFNTLLSRIVLAILFIRMS